MNRNRSEDRGYCAKKKVNRCQSVRSNISRRHFTVNHDRKSYIVSDGGGGEDGSICNLIRWMWQLKEHNFFPSREYFCFAHSRQDDEDGLKCTSIRLRGRTENNPWETTIFLSVNIQHYVKNSRELSRKESLVREQGSIVRVLPHMTRGRKRDRNQVSRKLGTRLLLSPSRALFQGEDHTCPSCLLDA